MLARVFRTLVIDLPMRRIEKKLQKMEHQKKREESPTGKHNSAGEREAKYQALLKDKAKLQSVLQDDNNGKQIFVTTRSIDVTMLSHVYQTLGCPLPPSAIEEIIWEVDDSLDGAVSYEEFEKSYLRCKVDQSGLEPWELFYLSCFLMFDKDCTGRIALDDAMRIFYMKYGDAMENEMEVHFGKQLNEGVSFISFGEYHDAILKRQGELIDQHGGLAKTTRATHKG